MGGGREGVEGSGLVVDGCLVVDGLPEPRFQHY